MSILRSFILKANNFLKIQNTLRTSVRFENARIDPANHKVNNLEKKFLVWTGKYKTVEEVPAYVPQNVIERARNRMRIRVANYMMLFTAIGCFAMVYLGKQAAARGDSLAKRNAEWHKQMQEKDAKKNA